MHISYLNGNSWYEWNVYWLEVEFESIVNNFGFDIGMLMVLVELDVSWNMLLDVVYV